MNILKNIKNIAILTGKIPLISSIFAGIVIGVCAFGIVMPRITNADFANTTNASYVAKTANEAQKAVYPVKSAPQSGAVSSKAGQINGVKTIKVVVTAYSSTPGQTDDTPFTTASGKSVRDGVIANNLLPFGTKIMIPELYGDKVFVVEDRMNKRMGEHRFDIWMPSRDLAINFGVKTAEIQVLEN